MCVYTFNLNFWPLSDEISDHQPSNYSFTFTYIEKILVCTIVIEGMGMADCDYSYFHVFMASSAINTYIHCYIFGKMQH